MRIMGRPRALVAVVAGALLLAGCGSGPSQVGAAVIVGDRSVSLDQVQSMIDQAVREQPYAQKLAGEHKLDLLGREIVRQSVLHELTLRAAKQEGIVADQAKIAGLAAKESATPVSDTGQGDQVAVTQIVSKLRDRNETAGDVVLEQQLAAKYLPKLAVGADYVGIGATSETDPDARARAFDLAKQFADDPGKIQGTIQQASQEAQQAQQTGAPGPGGFSDAGLTELFGASQYLALAQTALFGSAANSVVVFQARMPAKPDWYVFVIRSRGTDKAVPADQEAQKPTDEQLTAIGTRLLQPYLGQSGLRVNPRYGVWDVVSMNLATSQGATQGTVLPLRGAAPAQQ
jgi:outer membrane murein-binding lipoprotein Lpp